MAATNKSKAAAAAKKEAPATAAKTTAAPAAKSKSKVFFDQTDPHLWVNENWDANKKRMRQIAEDRNHGVQLNDDEVRYSIERAISAGFVNEDLEVTEIK